MLVALAIWSLGGSHAPMAPLGIALVLALHGSPTPSPSEPWGSLGHPLISSWRHPYPQHIPSAAIEMALHRDATMVYWLCHPEEYCHSWDSPGALLQNVGSRDFKSSCPKALEFHCMTTSHCLSITWHRFGLFPPLGNRLPCAFMCKLLCARGISLLLVYARNGVLGHMVILCLTFRGTPKVFSCTI